ATGVAAVAATAEQAAAVEQAEVAGAATATVVAAVVATSVASIALIATGVARNFLEHSAGNHAGAGDHFLARHADAHRPGRLAGHLDLLAHGVLLDAGFRDALGHADAALLLADFSAASLDLDNLG